MSAVVPSLPPKEDEPAEASPAAEENSKEEQTQPASHTRAWGRAITKIRASQSFIPEEQKPQREYEVIIHQTCLLLRKNYILQKRSRAALATQLFVGLIFVGLLRVLQISIESNPWFRNDFFKVRNPTSNDVLFPSECIPGDAWDDDRGCLSFIVAPNSTDSLGAFARNVAQEMANTASLPGIGEQRGWAMMESEEAIDSWLFAHPNATNVAIIFHSEGEYQSPYWVERSDFQPISYTLQYNGTQICNVIDVLDCTNPKVDLMASFQRLVDQSMLRVKSGNKEAKIDVAFADFPHPAGSLDWDVMEDQGKNWLYIAIIFNFIIQLVSIVTEKERKLRDAMAQMGMRRTAYWLSWFISCEIINVLAVTFLCLFGMAVDMEFFTENEFSVIFYLLFLSTTAFTMLAFLFSTLVSTAEAARNAGMAWYLLTFITMPLITSFIFYRGSSHYESHIWGLSFIASAPFYKGLQDLITASSGGAAKGMHWDRWSGKDGDRYAKSDINWALDAGIDQDGKRPWHTLTSSYESLWFCCILYAILTWYLDHVVPNSYGLAHSPFFFLDINYWRGTKDNDSMQSDDASFWCKNRAKAETEARQYYQHEDVKKEEMRVKTNDFPEWEPAIVVRDLKKKFRKRIYNYVHSDSWGGALFFAAMPAALFGSAIGAGGGVGIFAVFFLIFKVRLVPVIGSFKVRMMPTFNIEEFEAVKGTTFAVEPNSLFVILGHNGAGKSTTFNMLSGLMPVSSGDAKIFGKSIKTDLEEISKTMGYCPQYDVLWNELTGREHLEIYGRLKNIPDDKLDAEIKKRLDDVLLTEVADRVSGNYSGGMQRRLSLAIALLGDPKVIFMDEPTTGMDPVTRRNVWNCISEAKKGRVIVLTTHAMEEADILGDKIAVMSGGRIQAIGNSLHLKKKFGNGFRLSLFVDKEAGANGAFDKIKSFMENAVVENTYNSNVHGVMTYNFGSLDSTNPAVLTDFFKALEENQVCFGIQEISIGNSTLDDVFINLARKAEESDEFGYTPNASNGLQKKASLRGPNVVRQESKIVRAMSLRGSSTTEAGETDEKPSACENLFSLIFKCCFSKPKTRCDCGCGTSCCCFGRPSKISDNVRKFAGKSDTEIREDLRSKYPKVPDLKKFCASTDVVFGKPFKINGMESIALKILEDDTALKSSDPTISMSTIYHAAVEHLTVEIILPLLKEEKERKEEEEKNKKWPMLDRISARLSNLCVREGDSVSQTTALIRKTASFQWRQKWTMAAVISCPSIFAIIVFLLGALVFLPMSENSVKKWSYSCLQEDLKITSHAGPTVAVGQISAKNRKYEDGSWPPMYGEESPSWEFFISGAVEAGHLTSSSDDQRWYDRLLRQADLREGCEKTYTRAFKTWDNEIVGELYNDPGSLTYAEWWDEYKNKSVEWIGESCKKRLNGKLRTRKLTAGKPTNSSKWGFAKLKHARRNCQMIENPLNNFTAAPKTSRDGHGLFQYFHAKNIVDRRFQPQFEALVMTAYYFLPEAGYCRGFGPLNGATPEASCGALDKDRRCVYNWFGDDTCDYVPGFLKNGTKGTAVPRIATYLCKNSNVTSIRSALIIALDTGGSDNRKVDGFCSFWENMDSIRGTKATRVGSKKSDAENALWEAWGGTYDATLEKHRSTLSAYHFENADDSRAQYSYVAFLNYTGLCGLRQGYREWCETWEFEKYAPNDDYLFEEFGSARPLTAMTKTVQALMNNAIMQKHTGYSIDFDTKNFPTIVDRCSYDPFHCRSVVDFIAIAFVPYILAMFIVVIVGLVVYEKQSRLREIMIMSGLKMRTYWLVTAGFYFAQYMLMMAFLYILSFATTLRTFTYHDFLPIFIFVMVWGVNMILFSLLACTFFNSVWTAVCVMLMVVVLSIQAGTTLIVQMVTNPGIMYDETPWVGYMWFPLLAMLRSCLWLIYGAAFSTRLTVENWTWYGYEGFSRGIYYMIGQSIVMIPLIYYFETVLGPSSRPWFFPYTDMVEWWVQRNSEKEAPIKLEEGSENLPEDVKKEEERVARGNDGRKKGEPELVVQVQNFRKVFEIEKGGFKCEEGRPKCENLKEEKVAVKNLTFGVNARECFGLLGHNGAGKTTTISMLCGLFKQTSGTATIAGLDLETEMSSIHEVMGVCPQHDILWNDLTAREHLIFYARLRKIQEHKVQDAVTKALDEVNLLEWGDVLSSRFSGGMKRRLSTACSLVGNPKVVYMDEPSTGLDPASRHRLWDVINTSKGKNSILLTTHSMEEADLLCDRIGIMGGGVMQCVDTGANLKKRFGKGYRLTLILEDKRKENATEAVEALIREILPQASKLEKALGGIVEYEVDREGMTLSDVHEKIEGKKRALGISDWGLTETTLEEVFMRVTSKEHVRGKAGGGAQYNTEGKLASSEDKRTNTGAEV